MKDYWLIVFIPVGLLILAYRYDIDVLYNISAGGFIGIGMAACYPNCRSLKVKNHE